MHSPAAWFYRTFTHPNFQRMEECRTLVHWLNSRQGERILDVGCGDGFYDYAIARSGAHVIGVDINDKRLAAARKRNATERREVRLMDAGTMDLPDGYFDKVVSFCVIEHFHHDQRVLDHIRPS